MKWFEVKKKKLKKFVYKKKLAAIKLDAAIAWKKCQVFVKVNYVLLCKIRG